MKNRFRILVGCLTAAAMMGISSAQAAFLITVTLDNAGSSQFGTSPAGPYAFNTGISAAGTVTSTSTTYSNSNFTAPSGGIFLIGSDNTDPFDYNLDYSVTQTASSLLLTRLNLVLNGDANDAPNLKVTVTITADGFTFPGGVGSTLVLTSSTLYRGATNASGSSTVQISANTSFGGSVSSPTLTLGSSQTYAAGSNLTRGAGTASITESFSLLQRGNTNAQFGGASSFITVTTTPAPATVFAAIAGIPALAGMVRLRRKVTA